MADKKEIEETEQLLMQALAMQSPEPAEEFAVHAGKEKPADEKNASKEDIIEALKTVCDPEIMNGADL